MTPLFAASQAARNEITAVSWNVHKGRSLLGFATWNAMRRWVESIHADIYFLQETIARRMRRSVLASGPGATMEDTVDDIWHCQATEIARTLNWQISLGPNVFKPSWRHGNAILSLHPLDLSGHWDISAHRFERRGLLVARATLVGAAPITLMCAHLALTRAARLRQMTWIARWIAHHAQDGPLVLAGDFNDWRNDSVPLFGEIGLFEVATLLGESGRTFPAFSPALALDKMFVRGLTPLEWQVPTDDTAWLSDHLPYIARLRLG
ncbi:MAG: endonuclease/exonuclease/phosphatase family protein [Burkholderia sp.]